MRPYQEDEPDEYRAEHRDAPGTPRGQGTGGRPPARQSRYQSSTQGQRTQPPPQAPPYQPPPSGAGPGGQTGQAGQARRTEKTWQQPPGDGPPQERPPEQPSGQPEYVTERAPAGGQGVRGPSEQRSAQTPARQQSTEAAGAQSGVQEPAGRPPQGGWAGARDLDPAAVGDLAEREVVTVERDTPIATVVAEMAEKNVGSVVIVEDDSPVGIVTDRQIALALETMPDVSERQADELIDGDFVTGSADMTVLEALRQLSDAGVRRLPLVDEDGKLAGIVTVDDVLVLFSEGLSNVVEIIQAQSPQR